MHYPITFPWVCVSYLKYTWVDFFLFPGLVYFSFHYWWFHFTFEIRRIIHFPKCKPPKRVYSEKYHSLPFLWNPFSYLLYIYNFLVFWCIRLMFLFAKKNKQTYIYMFSYFSFLTPKWTYHICSFEFWFFFSVNNIF